MSTLHATRFKIATEPALCGGLFLSSFLQGQTAGSQLEQFQVGSLIRNPTRKRVDWSNPVRTSLTRRVPILRLTWTCSNFSCLRQPKTGNMTR